MTNGNGNGSASKPHWLYESFGGVNIIVLIGAVVAVAGVIFQSTSTIGYLSERVETLETEIDGMSARATQIAQLTWQIDGLKDDQNRSAVQIETLQQHQRDLQSRVRDLERDLEREQRN